MSRGNTSSTWECTECPEDFRTFDEFAAHMAEKHGVDTR